MVTPQIQSSPKNATLDRRALSEILNSKKFESLVDTLSSQASLARDERYALGYAYLRQHSLREALKVWAPLIGKLGVKFDEDCTQLVVAILDGDFWKKIDANDVMIDEATQIFLAARKLLPQADSRVQSLRNFIFGTLWNCGSKVSHKALLDLLVSKKEVLDAKNFLNAAKIRYHLYGQSPDFSKFIGHFLTASLTHAVATCGDESSFIDTMNGLTQAATADLINEPTIRFVNLQMRIVAQCLSHLGLEKIKALGLISVPSFFVGLEKTSSDYALAVPFFKQLPPEFQYFYTEEGVLVLKLQAGLAEKRDTSNIFSYRKKNGVETVFYKKPMPLDIKLRLAMAALERGEVAAAALFKDMSEQLSEFSGLVNEHFLAINFATIFANFKFDEQSRFWDVVFKVIPRDVWNQSSRKQISKLVLQSATSLHDHHRHWVPLLRNLVNFTDDYEQMLDLDVILQRLTEAGSLLEAVASKTVKKCYPKIWKKSAPLEDLKNFLTLVCDTVYLSYPGHIFWEKAQKIDAHGEQTHDYSDFLKTIFSLKHITALWPAGLQERLSISCSCFECTHIILIDGLSELSSTLELKTFSLGSLKSCGPKSEVAAAAGFINPLTQDNPYKVLDVDTAASKADILAKTMVLMRQNPSKMASYRSAQAELFHPQRRPLHSFIWCLEQSFSPNGTQTTPEKSKIDVSKITLLDEWSSVGRSSTKH